MERELKAKFAARKLIGRMSDETIQFAATKETNFVHQAQQRVPASHIGHGQALAQFRQERHRPACVARLTAMTKKVDVNAFAGNQRSIPQPGDNAGLRLVFVDDQRSLAAAYPDALGSAAPCRKRGRSMRISNSNVQYCNAVGHVKAPLKLAWCGIGSRVRVSREIMVHDDDFRYQSHGARSLQRPSIFGFVFSIQVLEMPLWACHEPDPRRAVYVPK
jgi:hypothetical protein